MAMLLQNKEPGRLVAFRPSVKGTLDLKEVYSVSLGKSVSIQEFLKWTAFMILHRKEIHQEDAHIFERLSKEWKAD